MDFAAERSHHVRLNTEQAFIFENHFGPPKITLFSEKISAAMYCMSKY
jgi:hypothetical protein